MSHSYFFRCVLYDATGTIEVGFARNFAQDLLDGLEAREFRRSYHTKQD